MNIRIRQAELLDKESILKIADLLFLNTVPEFVWNTDEFVARQINNQAYFVAEADGEIAGIMSFRQRRNKMYIETLAVAEKYRQNGISIELISFAKKYAKEKGFDILFICSFFEYNAVDYYKNQGFNLLKRESEYNGHKYHCFDMKL